MNQKLKQQVVDANKALVSSGLITLTWGNVSAIDRESGLIAIKPSGVAYEELTTANLVILNLNGDVVEGDLRPSSDTKTHLELYRNFSDIAAVVHTHSPSATAFSQAGVCPIVPCLGTTHADHFLWRGSPCPRASTPEEGGGRLRTRPPGSASSSASTSSVSTRWKCPPFYSSITPPSPGASLFRTP